MSCIFCKIVKGEIPSAKLYEDENMIIINDISPQVSKHYLMIPKEHYASIIEMSDSQAIILAKCIKKLSTLTEELGLEGGFRIVSNCGDNACQTVKHLHIHILGGQMLSGTMA